MRLQPSQPLSQATDLEAQRRERLENLLQQERRALVIPEPNQPVNAVEPAIVFTPPGLKRR